MLRNFGFNIRAFGLSVKGAHRGAPFRQSCFSLLGSSIFLAFSIFPAHAGGELTKLADNVYVQIVSPDSNAVSNSGIVILEHSVLVFDSHFTPEAGQALRTEIKSITSKPVAYVVNSHAHPDHTHGNQVFPDAQLIGSLNTRLGVLQTDLPSLNRSLAVTQAQLDKLRRNATQEINPDQGRRLREQIKSREDYLAAMAAQKIIAPFIALDDALTIQDGVQEVRILFLGPGHSDGDTILFLPWAKTVFVGDLFFNEAIPNVQDAQLLEWIKTIEKILELDAEEFIPGHGKIGSRKDLEQFLGYLRELRLLVEPYIERGDSQEQATREIQVPKKYSSYLFQNFFQANVQKMYTEVKAAQLASIPVEGPQSPDRDKGKK
jgi:cyclase